jgi:hypothetical protein
LLKGKELLKGKCWRGVDRKSAQRSLIGFRKQSRERTSYIGLRKAKAKENPKRTWDSGQCKSKDQDLKSCAYAGCRRGCLQVWAPRH